AGTAIIDRLSRTIESARRRTHELEQLQRLSQMLLEGIPDESRLASVIVSVVPGMFPLCHIAIWLYPDQALLTWPDHWPGPGDECWIWEPERTASIVLMPRDPRPWLGQTGREGVIVAPMIESPGKRVLGRIYLHREQRLGTFRHLLPAVQKLADEI